MQRVGLVLQKRTVLIQAALIAFLAGLILARLGVRLHWHYVLLSLSPCVLLIKKSPLAVGAVVLAALCVGIWRGQTVLNGLAPLGLLRDEKVTIIGQIEDDPSVLDNKQTKFYLQKLRRVHGDEAVTLDGRIRVRGFPGNKLNRGDVVEVSGKLRPALGNSQGQISYAAIELLAHKDTPLERWRARFFAGTYTALPEPQASLGLGFLVGLRTLLPKSLLEQLSATGLTHIVAVSGYNLTILVRLMRRWLAKYSKYLATTASVTLIIGFMAVTGISPSIFRAAVVSGLSLAAWYYGRPITPMMVLWLSAALTAGINPTYLWQDLGWHLSFLAFFGVLVLAPTVSARLFKAKQPPAIAQLVIETTCAQVMALPLIMLIFGEVSLIALPANVLILPLIPLAMLLTFIAGVAGTLLPSLVGWLAWPAVGLLTLMVKIVKSLAGVSWASTEAKLGVWQLSLIYGSILAVLATMRRKVRDILDPYYTVIK